MIVVNLPVTQLARAIAFCEAWGHTKEPTFSDNASAGMVCCDTLHAVLLTRNKYRHFSARPLADAPASSAAPIALNADSPDAVNATVAVAVAAG